MSNQGLGRGTPGGGRARTCRGSAEGRGASFAGMRTLLALEAADTRNDCSTPFAVQTLRGLLVSTPARGELLLFRNETSDCRGRLCPLHRARFARSEGNVG